jgi:hypothetical protein
MVLYVSPALILLPQGQEHERTTMENLALAEELAGSDELDELYKLDASESGPEGDEVEPEDIPHEAEPEDIPHEAEPEDIPHE